MKNNEAILKASVDRLLIYYWVLQRLTGDGYEVVSSEMLGYCAKIPPTRVRKDLAAVGELGKKGVGYAVEHLIRNIGRMLGLNQKWNFAVVGIGPLVRVLINSRKFTDMAFQLEAVFSVRSEIIGKYLNGVEISHIDSLEKIIQERNIHIAVITTPRKIAQPLADRLVAAGIKGIWNFTPANLKVPENIPVVNEDLSIGLTSLSYYILNESEKIVDNSTDLFAK